ncbi:MAG: hypothetical protein J6Y91_06605 [Alphaproteobacteria bacterium]|nr:hypothetical protein [Alphaproteobacteria bacterium]
MKKLCCLCIWSSVSFFSYTDLRITPADISIYGIVEDDMPELLPFIIGQDIYEFYD